MWRFIKTTRHGSCLRLRALCVLFVLTAMSRPQVLLQRMGLGNLQGEGMAIVDGRPVARVLCVWRLTKPAD